MLQKKKTLYEKLSGTDNCKHKHRSDIMETMPISENIECSLDSCSKLGPCEVCGSSEAKYTCPRCEVKTCGLACVNIHKKELECDGLRSKIDYKPLSKFQNLDLLSDYRLLEDVTRSVKKLQTNPLKRVSRFLPGYLHVLGKASKDRGMRLHFLPRNFQRAKENTSRLVPPPPSRLIYWRVEWLFPQAGVRLISEKVSETLRIAEVLSPLLDPEREDSQDHREALQYYYSAGTSGVLALMRVGEMERHRFHVLDMDTSLRGNLMRKSIVEFPTILIILKDHVYSYEIYNSDEETEQWRGNWDANTPAKSNVSLKPEKDSANSNLLFGGSDMSSDDEEN